MALTSTIYRFMLTVSNVDRGAYETLDLRVACHPSETQHYLLTRVLAYALHHEEGIAFSKGGLSSSDEAAISIRSLDGVLRAVIEIGSPSPERLHRASKASPRVIVYTQHDPELLLRELRRAEIHRKDELEIYAMPRELLDSLAAVLARNNSWEITLNEGELYVNAGAKHLRTTLTLHHVDSPA